MRFTENRPIAYIVLAIAVVFSIVFQGSLAMQNQRGDIEEKFMTGEPYHQATRCAEAAQVLAQTAGLYLTEPMAAEHSTPATAETLKSGGYLDAAAQLTELADLLTDRTRTANPNAVVDCLTQLSASAEKTYSGAAMLDIPETQQRDIKLAYYDLNGALDILSRDGDEKGSYTQLANKFNKSIGGFPAAIFANLLDIDPLSTYGG